MCLFLFLIFAPDFGWHFPVSLHVLQFMDLCQVLYIKKKNKEISAPPHPHPSERAFSLAARIRNWLYIDLFRRWTMPAVGRNLTSFFFFSSLVLFNSPVNIMFLFNWSTVDLLCSVSCKCTANDWIIIYMHVNIYICDSEKESQALFHYRLLQDI